MLRLVTAFQLAPNLAPNLSLMSTNYPDSFHAPSEAFMVFVFFFVVVCCLFLVTGPVRDLFPEGESNEKRKAVQEV